MTKGDKIMLPRLASHELSVLYILIAIMDRDLGLTEFATGTLLAIFCCTFSGISSGPIYYIGFRVQAG